MAALLWILACAPESGPPPAARLGDRTLAAERLATWLVLGQPLPLEAPVARGLARHWVELTALAERAATWDSLLEPELVRAAQWPEVRRRVAERYLGGRIPVVDPDMDEVRRAYGAGAIRLVAHVLRRATPQSHPEERQRQEGEIRRIRRELGQGMPWPQAVARSEDEDTKGRSGLLGLVRRGDLDPALDSAAFRLRPGELSPVLSSADGYHVLYRPRLEDVAPIFRDLLAEDGRARAASELLRGISEEWQVALEAGWEAAMREIAADPWSALDGSRAVAAHRAGVVADSVVARYLLGLDPDALRGLARAPSAELEAVLRDVASQEVLWLRMRSEGVEVDDGVLAAVAADHRAAMEALAAALGIRAGVVADPGAAAASHLEAVLARRRELVPVPPHLVVLLLRDRAWEVSDEGVAAAVERAARLLAEAGS